MTWRVYYKKEARKERIEEQASIKLNASKKQSKSSGNRHRHRRHHHNEEKIVQQKRE